MTTTGGGPPSTHGEDTGSDGGAGPRPGPTSSGATRRDPEPADPTTPGPIEPDPSTPDLPGPTEPDPTEPDPTRPDPTRPDLSRPDPTGPVAALPDLPPLPAGGPPPPFWPVPGPGPWANSWPPAAPSPWQRPGTPAAPGPTGGADPGATAQWPGRPRDGSGHPAPWPQAYWGPPTGPGPGSGPWAGGSGPQPWGGPYDPPLPAPPRRSRRTLVTLLLVGALALVGLGVGVVLLIGELRPGGSANLADIRTDTLTYGAPEEWIRDDTPLNDSLGLQYAGVARAPGYDCGGGSYLRGLVASSVLPGAHPADAVATTIASTLATDYYTQGDGATPTVTLGPTRTVDVSGTPSTLAEADVETTVGDGCLATSGVVLVLAVPITGADGTEAVALLVVNGDTAGGPDTTPAVERSVLDAIVASARLTAI